MDKKSYVARKAAGVCVACGKEKAVPGKTRCEKCLEYARKDAKLRYSSMTAERRREWNKQNHARYKAIREERKRLGLCTYCGKRPARPARTLCAGCAARESARQKKDRMLDAACKFQMEEAERRAWEAEILGDEQVRG